MTSDTMKLYGAGIASLTSLVCTSISRASICISGQSLTASARGELGKMTEIQFAMLTLALVSLTVCVGYLLVKTFQMQRTIDIQQDKINALRNAVYRKGL